MHGNTNLVTCAVIKVESESEYYIRVDANDIMKASLLIKDFFDKLGMPVSRIYLTGFQLVSKNDIYPLEELHENLSRMINPYAAYESSKIAKR